MKTRFWLVLISLVLLPDFVHGQALDSTEVAEIVAAIRADVDRLRQPADLQFLSRRLDGIEEAFGVAFPIPRSEGPEPMRGRPHLEVVYREAGLEAALDEAAEMEKTSPYPWWQPLVLEMSARSGTLGEAFDAAARRELLLTASLQLLNGAGYGRIREVLEWIESAELPDSVGRELRIRALEHGTVAAPWHYWQVADTVPEPGRTRIRTRALTVSGGFDSIPTGSIRAAIPEMLREAPGLQGELDADAVRRTIAAVCVRRRMIDVCTGEGIPADALNRFAWSDFVNLFGHGRFQEALAQLDYIRRDADLLVEARIRAQALEATESGCGTEHCDVAFLDSIAGAWTEDLLAIEAQATRGEIAVTSEWNGTSDLEELRRALATAMARRDSELALALADRMENRQWADQVVDRVVSSMAVVDIARAAEVALARVKQDGTVPRVSYSELMRAGHDDLANRVLEGSTARARSHELMGWATVLIRAGRTAAAREFYRRSWEDPAIFEYPAGSSSLYLHLASLGLVRDYLERVGGLDAPVARLNGRVPIVEGWIQAREARSRLIGGPPPPTPAGGR